MIRFSLSTEPIVAPSLGNNSTGAFASFEGRVRNEHGGRAVLRLDYEAHPELAIQEGEALLNEALQRFRLTEVQAIHRTGTLELGETAIWIGVLSPHRKEAFEALAWIMDEFKRRVPIWKKEHFAEGEAEWVGITDATGSMPPTEALLFDRQVRLAEVGEEGQRALKAARVLVVGAGGLGCAALPYLAAAGVGTIGICDFDRVESSNLHRQVLYGVGDVGRPKSEMAAAAIRRMHSYTVVHDYHVHLSMDNVQEICDPYDLILDCTDNFQTKFLLNAICVQQQKTLLVASIHRFEGQLIKVNPGAYSACLRCLWPDQPADGCVGTCAEVGVLGVVPGVLGTMQTAEAIKHILGLDSPLQNSVLLVDLMTLSTTRLNLQKHDACSVCGTGERADQGIEIQLAELLKRSPESVILLDVREMEEPRPLGPLQTWNWLHIPLSRFQSAMHRLDANAHYVVVCLSGARSLAVADYLRNLGFTDVRTLHGGMDLVERLSRA